MIYFDNAATTYHKPPCVIEAVVDAMSHMGNAGRGAHGASLGAARVIYETRQMLAEMFGVGDGSRVAFTANSTEALNIAIQGILEPGDHVITTAMEHNSVLRPLYLMEEKGVRLTVIPADEKGRIQYEDFEASIGPDTKAIVCTHASNLTGNVIDLKRVGKICSHHDLLFVVDASQSAGVLPINMEEMGIHILCFTGHKSLMGPQGIGGICVREGVEVRPLLAGGSGVQSFSKRHPAQMPTALEAGTLNGHGIAGLGAALRFIRDTGMEKIYEKEQMLTKRFYEGVKGLPGVRIYGDFETMQYDCDMDKRAPIVSLNIGDADSGQVADELAYSYEIFTRAGAHCAPLLHQALGTAEQGAVRFSFSYLNTVEEVDQAIEAIRQLTGKGEEKL